jgi:hypothetical protein
MFKIILNVESESFFIISNTFIQRQVQVGIILGDRYLEKTKSNYNTRLFIEYTLKKKNIFIVYILCLNF